MYNSYINMVIFKLLEAPVGWLLLDRGVDGVMKDIKGCVVIRRLKSVSHLEL